MSANAIHNGTPARRENIWKTLFVSFFGAVILVGGLYGFGGKIFRFILAWNGNADARFALVPVAMYIFVAVGFACIFAWASLNGMFSDIEGPKHRMLENERELDEKEEKEGVDPWA